MNGRGEKKEKRRVDERRGSEKGEKRRRKGKRRYEANKKNHAFIGRFKLQFSKSFAWVVGSNFGMNMV